MTQRTLIAIGVDKKGEIWSGHFGMAPQYNLYDRSGTLLEERPNPYGAGSSGGHTHHDNPNLIVDLLPECGTFIARRMGDASKQRLVTNLGIDVMIAEGKDVRAALDAYLSASSA